MPGPILKPWGSTISTSRALDTGTTNDTRPLPPIPLFIKAANFGTPSALSRRMRRPAAAWATA